MANQYGLDYKYFQAKLGLLVRDAKNYTPDEMARDLARMSKTADINVLNEPEFNRWISVEIAMPLAEQGEKVLGFNGDYIFECEFDDGCWSNLGGETMTHWMPLPGKPNQ